MKLKVALAAAIILAVAAGIGLRSFMERLKDQQREQQIPMLFAATTLKPGDVLTLDKVERIYVAGKPVHLGDVTYDRLNEFVGTPVQEYVEKGDVLNERNFAKPATQTDFTSEVGMGHRAISLPVDQITGVAGLVKARDRVDVIATMEFTTSSPGGTRSVLETLTVLEDVTVLAVDNRTAGYASVPLRFRRESDTSYTCVTLSVTPEEARILKLAQAQSQGMLTLALRNPTDRTSNLGKINIDELWEQIEKAAESRKTAPQRSTVPVGDGGEE